jgi:hypothetical protein
MSDNLQRYCAIRSALKSLRPDLYQHGTAPSALEFCVSGLPSATIGMRTEHTLMRCGKGPLPA